MRRAPVSWRRWEGEQLKSTSLRAALRTKREYLEAMQIEPQSEGERFCEEEEELSQK